jgi:alpha-glucuronidase
VRRGDRAVECAAPAQSCTAKFSFAGKPGRYEIDVQYFDQSNGVSKYRVFVGQRSVDEWLANASLPATKPDGDSSTRRAIPGIWLRPGDELRIEGFPDREERAALDYVELNPE